MIDRPVFNNASCTVRRSNSYKLDVVVVNYTIEEFKDRSFNQTIVAHQKSFKCCFYAIRNANTSGEEFLQKSLFFLSCLKLKFV